MKKSDRIKKPHKLIHHAQHRKTCECKKVKLITQLLAVRNIKLEILFFAVCALSAHLYKQADNFPAGI